MSLMHKVSRHVEKKRSTSRTPRTPLGARAIPIGPREVPIGTIVPEFALPASYNAVHAIAPRLSPRELNIASRINPLTVPVMVQVDRGFVTGPVETRYKIAIEAGAPAIATSYWLMDTRDDSHSS